MSQKRSFQHTIAGEWMSRLLCWSALHLFLISVNLEELHDPINKKSKLPIGDKGKFIVSSIRIDFLILAFDLESLRLFDFNNNNNIIHLKSIAKDVHEEEMKNNKQGVPGNLWDHPIYLHSRNPNMK